MEKRKLLRSALAMLLVVVFLVGMLPAVAAAESEDRQRITVNASQLMEAEEEAAREQGEAEIEEFQNSFSQQLLDQYGISDEASAEPVSKNDENSDVSHNCA